MLQVRVACEHGLVMELVTNMTVSQVKEQFMNNTGPWAVITTKDQAGQDVESYTKRSTVLNFTIIPEQKVDTAGGLILGGPRG